MLAVPSISRIRYWGMPAARDCDRTSIVTVAARPSRFRHAATVVIATPVFACHGHLPSCEAVRDSPDGVMPGAYRQCHRGRSEREEIVMNRYPNISDHGLIGDLQTAALVTTDGTVDFFCCPRFDSPSVFASLLDAEQGGYFRVSPRLTAGQLPPSLHPPGADQRRDHPQPPA